MNRRRFFGGIFAAGSACCVDQPEIEQPTQDRAPPPAPRLAVESRSLDLARDLRAASTRGGGTVSVTEGVIQIGAPLTIGTGVNLHLGRGATLQAATNANIVEVEMGGRVEGGGTVDTTAVADFSNAAIFFRGTRQWRSASHHTVIGDLRILGTYQEGGTGIHLLADGPGTSVCWVKFSGVDVQRMHTGIKLEAVNRSGEGVAWVNGNRFDVDLAGVNYGIRLIASDPATERTNGNWFRCQVQTTRQTQRVVAGDGRFNDFDLMVWDWGEDRSGFPTAIEFSRVAGENSLRARTLTPSAVLDGGRGNNTDLRESVAGRRQLG